MQMLLLLVVGADEELHGAFGYEALASGVYETRNPSTTQVAAVGRAARQLESAGLVEIYAWEEDKRQMIVAPSPWLRAVAPFLDEIDKLVPDTKSVIKQLTILVEVLKTLVEEGMIVVSTPEGALDPRQRQLTIDGPRRSAASDDGQQSPQGHADQEM